MSRLLNSVFFFLNIFSLDLKMKIIAVPSLCLILVCFALAKSINEDCVGLDINKKCDKDLLPTIEPMWDIHEADTNEFPYHVGVVSIDKKTGHRKLVCQGALITDFWFFSSANCIRMNIDILGDDVTRAIMGTLHYTNPNAITRQIKYYLYHPNFNKQTGIGPDLVMMMLKYPINLKKINPKPVQMYSIDKNIINDCKFSSYVNDVLYGNHVQLSREEFCELIGVPDDIHFCAVMNMSITRRPELDGYELGAPITCRGTLYGIRNSKGYFTTTIFTLTRRWVRTMIHMIEHNKLQNLTLYVDHIVRSVEGESSKYNPDVDPYNFGFLVSDGMRELKVPKDALEIMENFDIDKADNAIMSNINSLSDLLEVWGRSSRFQRSVKSSDRDDLRHLFMSWVKSVFQTSETDSYNLDDKVVEYIENRWKINPKG